MKSEVSNAASPYCDDFKSGVGPAASINKDGTQMSPTSSGSIPPLCQIAFSVVDLRLTERWFREGFGLLPAGGTRALTRGPLAGRVQGVPGAASTVWWLVGRNSWFQLELFQFERPIAKLMNPDLRPCDIGYTRIGIWVDDFDVTINKLAGLGSKPLTPPLESLAGGVPACAIPTGSMSKSWKTIRCLNSTSAGASIARRRSVR